VKTVWSPPACSIGRPNSVTAGAALSAGKLERADRLAERLALVDIWERHAIKQTHPPL